MSPRDRSQAQPRDARPERVQGGEKPLLQGHLKKKRFSPQSSVEQVPDAEVPPAADEPATPRSRGRATKSPENIATRRHLEGSDQGPK
ncbi:MAG TPA: hypothetical protein VGQ85_08910 [Candidatus Limnocylindrales bacterium]|nr:hypothetical protein [Candidatus Limnocylindrales bacterium]